MKRIAATLLSLSLLASGAAFAGPPQDHEHANQQPRSSAKHAQHQGNAPAPAASNGARHASSNSAHHAPRKGERLPQNQRGSQVADYSRHGLHTPGHGNEWRRVDDRYVLMAVATGLIIDIVNAQH